MSVLALIPARGGSKGIPRKNARAFLGRPLLAWTVDAARQSGVCDRIVVSTDDEEIAAIGRSCGAEAPFLRPAELAADTALTAPVVRHALDWLSGEERWSPEWVAVLEPTAPARRPQHLREALERLRASGADTVASVSAVPHHFAPSKQLRMTADGMITGVDGGAIRAMTHRRQELPVTYAFNGLVFACRAVLFRQEPPTLWGERVLGYEVEPRFAIDLDLPEDWSAAEARCRELLDEATAGRAG